MMISKKETCYLFMINNRENLFLHHYKLLFLVYNIHVMLMITRQNLTKQSTQQEILQTTTKGIS